MMSKEQQSAAAKRILEKHPLTEEEKQRYEMATRTPEQYMPPKEKRVCGMCGAEFRDTVDKNGNVQVSMLEKFSDHQAEHNATAAEWTEAYNKIQALKQSVHT